MSAASKIEWTDATWNPVGGCSIVWTGKVAAAPDRVWEQPLRWRKPRRVFVNSMGDLFHESVDETSIDKAFAIMALCPHHVFQVLTKRADRMRDYFESWPMDGQPDRITELACEIAHFFGRGFQGSGGLADRPLPNVWLMTSAERQEEYCLRGGDLIQTPAAIRGVSLEPLLGPIDLGAVGLPKLDWVIAGGESGPGARPAHPDWFRSIRDQCAAAGVPFFFKQWGNWIPYRPSMDGHVYIDGPTLDCDHCPKRKPTLKSGYAIDKVGAFPLWMMAMRVNKRCAGRELDGRTHDAMPGIADV